MSGRWHLVIGEDGTSVKDLRTEVGKVREIYGSHQCGADY